LKNQYFVIPAEEPESDNMFLFNEMPDPRIKCGAGKSGMTKVKKLGFSKISNITSKKRLIVLRIFILIFAKLPQCVEKSRQFCYIRPNSGK